MTDYYPLLKRAIEGLDKSTGEARRSLYERARTALVDQLRGMTPPLSESEITRERLALEEAVRKVEAEAARRLRDPIPEPTRSEPPRSELPRSEPPRSESPRSAPPPARSEPRSELPRSEQRPDPSRSELRPEPPRSELKRSETPRSDAARPESRPDPSRPRPPEPAPPASRRPEPRPPSPPPAPARPPRSPDLPGAPTNGVRGLRDVVADSETLGGAAASASRSAREAFAAVPSQSPELDRLEPRVEPEGLRGPVRQPPPARDLDGDLPPPVFSGADAPPPPPREAPRPRRRAGPMPRRVAGRDTEETNPARKGLIAALASVLILVSLGGAAYWQRDRISGLFGVVRSMAPQAPREASPTRPKVTDRVGGQDGQAETRPGTSQPGSAVPAVAQRVVLYEEDPGNQDGNRYVGSALWRTETISPGPGLAPEVAVRVDVEVPERRLAMTMSIRRNTDTSLPATHTVEIMFNLPADFPFGGVANVPGLLVKESEQTRGAPLSGLAVKVTNNFFLIGLSAVEADLQRNIQLLKDRPWFDIPIVYNNGRRAILAVEKGTPGERAFTDAFATWKQ